MTFRIVAFCDNPTCSNSAPMREFGPLSGPQAPLGWLHVDVHDWEDIPGESRSVRHLDLCSATCHEQVLDVIARDEVQRRTAQ